MKKLMITAAAVAMTAGAFATPVVYDFKASVKHMYLKQVRVNIRNGFNGTVYQKYQKSASLKGYLVQDMDGLTSVTITGSAAACTDVGRNRSFLVVQNNSAERAVRAPKVLPAILDAKYIDTRFTGTQATSGLAEGYLFVGGDSIASVDNQIDNLAGVLVDRGAVTPGIGAYSDYLWTSVYLFGQYNGPHWAQDFAAAPAAPLTAPFLNRETAIDGAFAGGVKRVAVATVAPLPVRPAAALAGMDTDGDGTADTFNYFHDTWMNGAGIGKYSTDVTDPAGILCCGLQRTAAGRTPPILETLSGNLKGGIFLCSENGVSALPVDVAAGGAFVPGTYAYMFFDASVSNWEDQFVASRLVPGVTFVADVWQNDIFLDGNTSQLTTDVVYGTWSIKRNRRFSTQAWVDAVADLPAADPAKAPLLALNDVGTAVCAAAFTLNRGANFWDGTEIFQALPTAPFAIPFLTPAFIANYGL